MLRFWSANSQASTSVSKTKISFFFFAAFILFSTVQFDERDIKREARRSCDETQMVTRTRALLLK